MSRNVRLNVEAVLFGVKTACEVEREGFVGSLAKLRGNLTDRYRVLVNNAVKGFIFFAVFGEVLKRSEIVTDGKISARLDARVG